MEKSSFFNSVNGDRKYKASDFAEFFNSLLTNGVFPTPSTNLQILSNGDMTITIKAGKAWINGYVYINDCDLILPISVADGVLNRIDTIVLRMDTVERNITAQVKKGAFASSPVAPSLQRNADAYELGIGYISIGAGAIHIVQANITDLRLDATKCGIVNSLIQADTTAIFNQYQSWFNTKTSQYNTDMVAMETQFQSEFNIWFNTIKDQLGTDVAGSLHNQINAIAGTGWTSETVKGNADAIAALETDYTKIVPYAGTTTGSANTYAISKPIITELMAGMAVSIKFGVDSTGISTLNWCGLGAKGIKKTNGTDATNLKATGIYTLRYDGSNFILQGEGAAGNATAASLLLGKTASTDTGDIVGTMPNNGAIMITPSAANQLIVAGYHNGSGYVAGDPDLVSANIKSGVNLFGVAGKSSVVETSDANVVAGAMLSSYSGYANGSKIAGTIASKGAATINPSTSTQTISAGQYISGTQIIEPVTGSAYANQVLSGCTFSSANGIGLTGTATMASLGGKYYASGRLYSDYNTSGGWFTTVTLPFIPAVVIAKYSGNSYVHLAVNQPSLIGLTTAVAWHSLPNYEGGTSKSSTIYSRAINGYSGTPAIQITGAVVTMSFGSSNYYYDWIAYAQ